jgi:hypothetical protein
MPWSASLIQATTSEHIAASKVPSSQGSDSAMPSLAVTAAFRQSTLEQRCAPVLQEK